VRVLCVTTDYPPHSEGGYELKCASFVDQLRGHGHDVEVLAATAAGASRAAGVHRELVRFPVRPRPTSAAAAWLAERRNAAALERRLRRFRPDVVSWWRLGELSMSLVARAATPSVGVVCDPWMLDGPRRDPWARRRGTGFRAAGRWLFVSADLRRRVLDGGVALARSEVVGDGIELDRFPLAPERPWRGRLLYAGRLSPLKGVDVAVRALARLAAGTTLDVVGTGDPSYEAELRHLAAALGVGERVRLRGPRRAAEMARVMAEADAVLFPVRWAEPWGRVPLEAMATGRPVIATGRGGSAEYLRDGENALLAAPDDAGALAAAVGRLAADPALRAALRRAGRTTAERHPIARAHEAARVALEEAVSGPRPRGAARRAGRRGGRR
jgi:glycosyltransferase involved in cell wall biosynthesis